MCRSVPPVPNAVPSPVRPRTGTGEELVPRSGQVPAPSVPDAPDERAAVGRERSAPGPPAPPPRPPRLPARRQRTRRPGSGPPGAGSSLPPTSNGHSIERLFEFLPCPQEIGKAFRKTSSIVSLLETTDTPDRSGSAAAVTDTSSQVRQSRRPPADRSTPRSHARPIKTPPCRPFDAAESRAADQDAPLPTVRRRGVTRGRSRRPLADRSTPRSHTRPNQTPDHRTVRRRGVTRGRSGRRPPTVRRRGATPGRTRPPTTTVRHRGVISGRSHPDQKVAAHRSPAGRDQSRHARTDV